VNPIFGMRCRVCDCHDEDCRGCIARTGAPCYWVEDDLCSACALRGLSLTQPWATLVALGRKKIETRSRPWRYVGPILIHAAKGFPGHAQAFAATERAHGRLPWRDSLGRPCELPLGAVVARAVLIRCRSTQDVIVSAVERHLGNFSAGRFALFLDDVEALPEPIPWKGALGLWKVPDELARAVNEQLPPRGFSVDQKVAMAAAAGIPFRPEQIARMQGGDE